MSPATLTGIALVVSVLAALVLPRRLAVLLAVGLCIAATALVVLYLASGAPPASLALPIGLPGAPMGEVTFDACPLPAIAVLGRPGAGLRVFASAMAWERSLLLAGFLGAAERNLRAAIRALAERDALRHQAVAHRIAAMHMRLATARHFVHTAAAALDAGREDAATAAMAKLAASEAVIACATDTARLLAGVGWRGVPFDTAAAIADTLGTLFASGTSEIQLDTIARHVIASARR